MKADVCDGKHLRTVFLENDYVTVNCDSTDRTVRFIEKRNLKKGDVKMSYFLRILLIIGSFMSATYVLKKIRKSQVRIEDALFWILESLVFIIMGLFPSVVIQLSELIGFESPANLVFLVIVFSLFMKVFFLSIEISTLKSKIERVVQHIAIWEKEINKH